VFPPASKERLQELGPFETIELTVEGAQLIVINLNLITITLKCD